MSVELFTLAGLTGFDSVKISLTGLENAVTSSEVDEHIMT